VYNNTVILGIRGTELETVKRKANTQGSVALHMQHDVLAVDGESTAYASVSSRPGGYGWNPAKFVRAGARAVSMRGHPVLA
jgi:hypothetical protein